MPPLPEPKPAELLAALGEFRDIQRDAELRGDEKPLLKLTWLRRQQRRAAPLVLTLLGICTASQFLVIWAVQPLMLRNPWYACLLIPLPFISFGLVLGWALPKVCRWFSLACPYCGAALIMPARVRSGSAPIDMERFRRCGSCHAVIVDPEA